MKHSRILNELHSEAEYIIRKEKIAALKAQGIQPWPEYTPVSATCSQARDLYTKNATQGKLSLAGRIMTRREHGKSFFATIQDRSGTIQIYGKIEKLTEELFKLFKETIDLGDYIWAEGTLFTTKTGEITLDIDSFKLLSKCLHALPEKYHGLTDLETKYRQRYLDLISSSESREKFKTRSLVIQGLRTALLKQDFLEVETPMLHPIPGGAAAKPFATYHNAYNTEFFLRIAPELYLKRLVIGGFERVFEINRNFRNEGVSTRHNPEFTMIELYMAHGDYKTGIELTEFLIKEALRAVGSPSLVFDFGEIKIDFSAPFKQISMIDSLTKIGNIAAENLTKENISKLCPKEFSNEIWQTLSEQEKIVTLFDHHVEKKLIEPTFVTGYPLEVSPLSKNDYSNPSLAARFELFIAGMELANGYSELNDPFDQAERFAMQADLRTTHQNDEAHHFDADYLRALEYGLPPTVGVGIGIDRLCMLATNTSSIKDIILFPTLRHEI